MTRALPALTESEKVERLRQMGLGPDLLPLSLTPQEREAAQESHMPDVPVVAAVSPTGAPVVGQTALKWIGGVLFVVASAFVAKQLDIPGTDIDQQVAAIALAALGFLSPGWRKAA